jgi:hypothetical protein
MKQKKQVLILFLWLLFTVDVLAMGDYQNSIFGGLGLGRNISEGHTEINLMIGYDKYFETEPIISAGIFIEQVFSTHNELILGIKAGVTPIEELKFWFAPCFVYGGGGRIFFEDERAGVEHFAYNNKFMFKFGGGYIFHIPNTRYFILPFIECGVVRSEFIIGLGAKFCLGFTNDFD